MHREIIGPRKYGIQPVEKRANCVGLPASRVAAITYFLGKSVMRTRWMASIVVHQSWRCRVKYRTDKHTHILDNVTCAKTDIHKKTNINQVKYRTSLGASRMCMHDT